MKTGTRKDTTPGRTVVVRFAAAADRGMALGHLDGKALFAPFGAPGDLAEVEILREKPRHLEGRIVRLLEPSPRRRPPVCPHFGRCGGCQWQHLSYAGQLEAKAAGFAGFLRTRLGLPAEKLRPPLPSPREWGYRNRVSLKIRGAGGRVALGFFERGSHRLVPLARCPVLETSLERLLEPLRSFLAEFAADGQVPQVDLQSGSGGRVGAVIHLLRPPGPTEDSRLRAFARDAALASLHLQFGRKATLRRVAGGSDRVESRLRCGSRELTLGVSVGGFVQANPDVNQAMVDEVTELSALYREKPVLDLFCGAGNFTLPLALSASEAVGVEGYPPAAADATHNARVNGLANVRVLADPAPRALADLRDGGFRPAFALLDPPRDGAVDAVGPLADLGPEWILYVSCAPATLCRDVGLLGGRGYRIEWARAADLFPQTAHLESLTLLRRSP